MGGYGSGRRGWGSPKETVESCLVLSVAGLQSGGLLAFGWCITGQTVTWRNTATGEKTASIGIDVDTFHHPDSPTARLHYNTTRPGEDHGEDLDYHVGLTTTPLPWGGVRWWFRCPLVVNGRSCRRRVGKLYLPRGARYFGCRHCYDLTYESTRRPAWLARLSDAELCRRAVGMRPRRRSRRRA